MRDDESRGGTPAPPGDEEQRPAPEPPGSAGKPGPAGKPPRPRTRGGSKKGGAPTERPDPGDGKKDAPAERPGPQDGAGGSAPRGRPSGKAGGAAARGKSAGATKPAGGAKKRAPAASRGRTAGRSAAAAASATGAAGTGTKQTAVASSRPELPEEPAVAGVAPATAHAGRAAGAGRSAVAGAVAPVERSPSSHRAPRLRAGISAFLVVAAVLAVLVSTLALWSRSVLFDTDAYVRVVAPVAEDPAARRAVAEYVAARTAHAARLESRLEDALPPDAAVLAPALAASLQRFLADEIEAFLGTELAGRLWVGVNRLAHEELIAALRGESRSVTIGRNDVTLNLLPLVAVALQRLEDRVPQLLGRDVTLPAIDPATAPDDIRILLRDALGRELPSDFGTITLLRGRQGWEARQALRIFNDLVVLAVVLTAVLIAAAVLVSTRRLRTTLWLGLGALLAFAAVRVIGARLEEAAAAAVTTQGEAAVARSILEATTASLNGFFVWVAVAGAVVAGAAVLAARPSWLQGVGSGVSRLFGAASDLSTPDTRAGRWMAVHLDLLRAGGVVAAVVALLFAAASLTAALLVVLALVAYELALAAYAAGVPGEPEERPADGAGPAQGPPSAPAG